MEQQEKHIYFTIFGWQNWLLFLPIPHRLFFKVTSFEFIFCVCFLFAFSFSFMAGRFYWLKQKYAMTYIGRLFHSQSLNGSNKKSRYFVDISDSVGYPKLSDSFANMLASNKTTIYTIKQWQIVAAYRIVYTSFIFPNKRNIEITARNVIFIEIFGRLCC